MRSGRRVLTTPEQKRGRASRVKGATFERWVASKLREIYPDAKRGIGQARSSSEVCDTEGTPWWVEAKRCRKVDYRAALAQACAATMASPGEYRVPIVVAKDDEKPPVVYMHLEDFLELLRKAEAK